MNDTPVGCGDVFVNEDGSVFRKMWTLRLESSFQGSLKSGGLLKGFRKVEGDTSFTGGTFNRQPEVLSEETESSKRSCSSCRKVETSRHGPCVHPL